MNRVPGDNAWNYIRIIPSIRQFVEMKPIGDNTYETVFLKGHPTLSATNSDEPPGSFHSRDIFAPHSSIPNAWKYLGRLDDRITLVNGEKVLPLPIEGRIRQEALVTEAIMFGIDRSSPGILVIRSDEARKLSDEQFVDAVWPAIQDANSQAESFSQISKDMIVVLPAGTQYPITDKGSIIRAQVYKKFADIIDRTYSQFEDSNAGKVEMNVSELEKYLMKLIAKILGVEFSTQTDFFAAGMDSLQALQARRMIQKEVFLGGNGGRLSQNVIFESGNIARLARRLVAIRKGTDEVQEQDDVVELMKSSIAHHSVFSPYTHTNSIKTTTGAAVVSLFMFC